MPHLRVRGVAEPALLAASVELIPTLAQLVGTAAENFTLEVVNSHFISAGAVVTPEPMVEVLWFSRPQETQDAVARAITDGLRKAGVLDDIAVFFQALTPTAYYDNGQHYG